MARKKPTPSPIEPGAASEPTPSSIHAGLKTWNPTTWSEVCDAWDALFPKPGPDLVTPRSQFQGHPIDPTQAGLVFERLILEGFEFGPTEGRRDIEKHQPITDRPFENRSRSGVLEQIDGIVWEGWQAFLIESKMEKGAVDFGPIAKLHLSIERRPLGCLGLLFSASGFTVPALELASLLRPIRVLLFDPDDFVKVFTQRDQCEGLMGIVRLKWQGAIKWGMPNYSSLKGEL